MRAENHRRTPLLTALFRLFSSSSHQSSGATVGSDSRAATTPPRPPLQASLVRAPDSLPLPFMFAASPRLAPPVHRTHSPTRRPHRQTTASHVEQKKKNKGRREATQQRTHSFPSIPFSS
ncbi:hypothetical protein JDV02_009334 [Purpureocillium takamizusanense]|uniref:Uncharacterized protein n=1 Tax=Purpureocillium takamizusanense TaxID=2060973 RepID=A0A9Q8QQG0_9HYPO|nr:uncharacterized protein JDV02_009334 [Purpureocillium takamizusanense]UNI23517.1 hypothetical protein JDV02_009334 [Purpureocillium takamizusanense]